MLQCKKYAFLTDIHLNCLSRASLDEFIEKCSDPSLDGYLISGDISCATTIVKHLELLENSWNVNGNKRIIFCAGNHDFWHGSINGVRNALIKLCRKYSHNSLHYVNHSNVIHLSDNTALVGHDGWYDAQNGDAKNSKFIMNDWFNVHEFNKITQNARLYGSLFRVDDECKLRIIELSQQLATEAVTHVRTALDAVVKTHQNVIVLTHVPPWADAHVHKGLRGDDDAQPWFTSKMMGEMLEHVASENPHINFTVLCGHTHGKCSLNVANNMICHVGHSDYVDPQIQFVLDV